MFFKTAMTLWENEFTPFPFLRKLGPLGSDKLIGRFVRNRMARVNKDEEHIAALVKYFH